MSHNPPVVGPQREGELRADLRVEIHVFAVIYTQTEAFFFFFKANFLPPDGFCTDVINSGADNYQEIESCGRKRKQAAQSQLLGRCRRIWCIIPPLHMLWSAHERAPENPDD